MAPQGRDTGATSHEGACANSNKERQGCSPFYLELIKDPYVDPVSGRDYFFHLSEKLFEDM